MYYGNNELEIIDLYINNKFIKKSIYIKALNSLNNFYLNMYMTFMEDTLMNYILYRKSNSFYFVKKIRYKYKTNTESITNKLFIVSKIRVKFIFIYIKFVFDFSKNTEYEKDMFNYLLNRMVKYFNILYNLSKINFNNDFYFYYEIIIMIINCIFMSNENMILLYKLKNIIETKINLYKNLLNKQILKKI